MNKLTWGDIGMVAEPGRYKTRLGWVEITIDDLAIWKNFPKATFAVVGLSPRRSAETVLRLGAFDINDDLEFDGEGFEINGGSEQRWSIIRWGAPVDSAGRVPEVARGCRKSAGPDPSVRRKISQAAGSFPQRPGQPQGEAARCCRSGAQFSRLKA